MHAHGVEVFHGADGDAVACGIPHDLKLDLLPAGDALFHKDLMNGRHAQAPFRDFPKFGLIRCNAAAAAAERKRRAHDDRIADLRRKGQRALERFAYHRRDHRFSDLLHGVFEALPVLRAVDGIGLCAEQLHAVAFQEAFLCKLHSEREPRLPAERGQDAIRLLLFDDAPERGQRERLNVNVIRHVAVRHDGSGVGIHKDGRDAGLFEHLACLRAGIIEFRSLADHNGAGANHKRALYILIERHCSSPPRSKQGIHQTGTRYPAGRRRPPGETAPKSRGIPHSVRLRRCRRWR